jgi:PAS domain S-box-containing protein
MKFDTAVALAALGVALWTAAAPAPTRVGRRITVAGSGLAAMLAGLALMEYAGSWDLRVDQLVVDDRLSGGLASAPGRMSTPTAVAVLLIALALVSLRAPRPWLGPVAGVAGALIGGLALLGYLYGATGLYDFGETTRIAPHTAAVVLVLGLGVVLARPALMPTALLADRGPAGLVARRSLIPVVVVVPLLGRLSLAGRRAGWYGPEFELAVVIVATTVLTAGLTVAITWSIAAAERRRMTAEAAHAEVADRFQRILDGTSAIIYAKDAQGRYLLANRHFADVGGVADGAALGHTDEELFGRPTPAAIQAVDRQVLEHGTVEAVEFDLPYRGELHSYHCVKFLLGAQGDMPPAVCSIALDVTERKEAQAEARALARQLQAVQRLDSLGRLAGGVAHDFNNLLSAILNYVQFAREAVVELTVPREERPRVAAIVSDLDQIGRAGERAAGLTRQLLVFGRRDTTRPSVLDLNVAVRDVESLLRRTLGEHIDLRTELTDRPLPVRIDPAQLEQIVVNLAINARDAMPDGGTLTIDTVADGGSEVRLRVSDTGVGMDADVRERAFEPFFTTKPKGSGTGLGLATAYGVITRAGGEISLDSEPGRGTSVEIVLPAADEPIAAATRTPAPRVAGSETILVAEDDDAVSELTRRLLTRNGYTVLIASSGPAALELADRHDGPIDLLLTDVVMPGMLGRELAERFAERRAGTPVRFMSGYTHAVLGEPDSEAARSVLGKPFTERALLEHVRAALEAASPSPAPPLGR